MADVVLGEQLGRYLQSKSGARFCNWRRMMSFWNSFSQIQIGVAVAKDLNPRGAKAA